MNNRFFNISTPHYEGFSNIKIPAFSLGIEILKNLRSFISPKMGTKMGSLQARWLKKGKKNIYGYTKHIGVDHNGLMLEYTPPQPMSTMVKA